MALDRYIITHADNTPQGGTGRRNYYVVDTWANRPTIGLFVGDLMYCADISGRGGGAVGAALLLADSATTWNGNVEAQEVAGFLLNLRSGAGGYHSFQSAASAVRIVTVANRDGQMILGDLTTGAITTPGPLDITTTGTGITRIGELGGISSYGALGMAGAIGSSTYNLASSPGDTNLYINRPTGKDIYIDNGTGTQQIQILSTAPINSIPTLAGNGSDPPASLAMGKVNRTAQNASIAAFNLTNGTPAGLYRISYFLRCTTSDVTAGTISFSTTYTDSVGATTETSATAALTSTANRANGTFIVDLASGNITGSTTLTGIAGTSQYKLRVRVEYLG